MSDLISRDDLIRKYGDWYIEEGTEWGYIGTLKNLISKEPAIDAVPVVHGAWVALDDDPPEDFECNVCGYVSTASFDCSGITPNAFPYCPMCGAKMDGGEDDEAD